MIGPRLLKGGGGISFGELDMKTTLIIDGDILAFRCAAASEKRSVKATHKTTGQVIECPHRTALKEQIKDAFELDEFDILDIRTPDDISHAYNAINTCVDAWMQTCMADGYEIYISGDNNFRDFLPLPSKYKGSRDELERPVLLKECRAYLVKRHKAEVIHGREVDDHLAQRAYEGNKERVKNIVVSLDKDSYGVDSWLYNWTKMKQPERIKGLGEIELDDKNKLRGKGRKWFYAQWVMGDPVDCFKPCEIVGKKFGDTGCYNLLKDCTTDKECVEAVYKQYKSWYPSPVTYKAWDGTEHTMSAIDLMDLYAACAWMQRWDGDVLDSREIMNKLGVAYD